LLEESLRLGKSITAILNSEEQDGLDFSKNWNSHVVKIGITGGSGAGKSSFINQLAKRFLESRFSIAILLIDPTSRLTGGALLADRVRLDSELSSHKIFTRSLATRKASDGLPERIIPILHFLENQNFDLIFIETIGIGQDSIAIRDVSEILITLPSGDVGDILQFFKIGVFEVSDYIFFNKSDLLDGGKSVKTENIISEYLSTKQWDDSQPPLAFYGNTIHGDGIDEIFQSLHERIQERFKHAKL
jgi:putative protein kinase ArgK-like GTPase of G3E family